MIEMLLQGQMRPTYQHCAAQRGSGCFERMKRHMNDSIGADRTPMFTVASQTLVAELRAMQVSQRAT